MTIVKEIGITGQLDSPHYQDGEVSKFLKMPTSEKNTILII